MLVGQGVEFLGRGIERVKRLDPADFAFLAGKVGVLDRRPIDKAVDLFTNLIVKGGAQPKSPSKR